MEDYYNLSDGSCDLGPTRGTNHSDHSAGPEQFIIILILMIIIFIITSMITC